LVENLLELVDHDQQPLTTVPCGQFAGDVGERPAPYAVSELVDRMQPTQ
jgi:hypothetical protein